MSELRRWRVTVWTTDPAGVIESELSAETWDAAAIRVADLLGDPSTITKLQVEEVSGPWAPISPHPDHH